MMYGVRLMIQIPELNDEGWTWGGSQTFDNKEDAEAEARRRNMGRALPVKPIEQYGDLSQQWWEVFEVPDVADL